MQRRCSVWLGLGLILALTLCWSAAAQEKGHFEKVGLVNFTIKSVSAGVGYSWGEGHLVFRDKTYPIKVTGLSIITAGISSTHIMGDVYNLKEPSDLAGKYNVLKAGLAAGVGQARATARNARGVSIDMVADTKGVKFDLGGGEFTIEMK